MFIALTDGFSVKQPATRNRRLAVGKRIEEEIRGEIDNPVLSTNRLSSVTLAVPNGFVCGNGKFVNILPFWKRVSSGLKVSYLAQC